MKGRWSEIIVVFRKELLDILRDRRAAFFTFIFPLVMYPVIFVAAGKFQDWKQSMVEDRKVLLGLSGDYDDFLPLVENRDNFQVVFDVHSDRRFFEDGDLDVLLEFKVLPKRENQAQVTVHFDGAGPMTRVALLRVRELLDQYNMFLVDQRFRKRGIDVRSSELVTVSRNDVSMAQEKGEAVLARILPALLILLFFTGGAFAAIDLVAGEKERKTLETLFVHPVSADNIAVAKFLVVLTCSIGAVALNLVGMVLAYKIGLNANAGWLAEITFPAWQWLALVTVLFLPMAVLTSSLLIAISSVAHSFREAQTYLIPVILGGLLPSLLCAVPNVELNLVTAWIPIGNIALAVRDAIAGDVRWPGLAVAFASTAFYAFLALRWSSRLLTREETLLGTESDSGDEHSVTRARSRRATIFSICLLLLLYYGGGFLQNPSGPFGLVGGVALTLWILVLGPALAYTLAGRASLRKAWGLELPTLKDLSLSVMVASAAVLLITAYMMLQAEWLPMSEDLANSFEQILDIESLHPLIIVAVFVISPAICEECLWRGTYQGELAVERRPLKAIVLVALFFGLFHFSFYRFVPTALVGAILAWVRWRTGSLVNTIVLHAAYNALLIFVMGPLIESQDPVCDALLHPWGLAAGIGVLFLAWRWMGTRRRPFATISAHERLEISNVE